MRLASTVRGMDHRITVPRHRQASIGTLNGIINDVAEYLGMTPAAVRRDLFGDLARNPDESRVDCEKEQTLCQ